MRIKNIFLYLFLIISYCYSTGQSVNFLPKKLCEPSPAYYPAGNQDLAKFLELNNVYNNEKFYLTVEGIVYVKLLIDSTGKVAESNILRGIGAGIDDEAIRLGNLLVFVPAKDSFCKKVSSEYTLKVSFPKPKKPTLDYVDDSKSVVIINTIPSNWHLRKTADPHFKGGLFKMKRYFRKNIKYSEEIIRRHIAGSVRLMLRINDQGELYDCIVYESPDQLLSKEAIRVVRTINFWHPAIVNHRHSGGILKVTVKFRTPG